MMDEADRRRLACELGERWLDRGCHLVPLQPGRKDLMAGYGARTRHVTTCRELATWVRRGANLGVVLGGPGNLIVADFESLDAWEAWTRTLGAGVASYTERSGRGMHIFFRGQGGGFMTAGVPDTVEILTSVVVAVAPSVHPSGALYEVVAEGDILPATAAQIEAWFPFVAARRADRDRARHVGARPTPPAASSRSTRPAGLIAEIKARWSVVDEARAMGLELLGGPVRFRCRCPFHDDTMPSMWFDLDSRTWGCRSPNCVVSQAAAAHDVINLRARRRTLDNKAAVAELVRELGLTAR